MKRSVLAIVILLALSMNMLGFVRAEDSNLISRNIIRSIEWDEPKKAILIKSVVVQKQEDSEIEVFDKVHPIYLESLRKKTLTNREASDYVHKHLPGSIASDVVLGKDVEPFKDLSRDPNVTDEDMQVWVNEAKLSVESDDREASQTNTLTVDENNTKNPIQEDAIFAIIVMAVFCMVFTTIVWSLTGLFLYYNASLTVRAYRKILLQIVGVCSATYGLFFAMGLMEGYTMQANIYLIGSLLLFLFSFAFVIIRRRTYMVILGWSVLCFAWGVIAPMEAEYPFRGWLL
ncbi:hypothetical protein ACFO9Q_13485 [Paenibacillus sp. GCM10023252]|uniref:hypothetical protein n=1 Tax=Paenibacillus sp. GCM10023252 TaxID=3252649 RepID=UPI003606FE6C